MGHLPLPLTFDPGHPMTSSNTAVKTVTKRDGSTEPFDPMKLIKWGSWAKRNLEGRVRWAQIAQSVLNQAFDGISTTRLQTLYINECLRQGDDAHNHMAGTLYAPLLHKDIMGETMPTVAAHHAHMLDLGLMVKLPYSEAEYAEVETFIDHPLDYKQAHYQLKQVVHKYSLQDRVTDKIYETPQYTYMRMAMALCSDDPVAERMTHVKNMYDLLSQNVINAPTPNYIYLGTPMNGLVSCCLYTTDDDIPSLSVGDHIAYRMTAIGAGIGGFIRARGLGEGVRGGAITHNGKLPYYGSKSKAVKANMQAGRAGAATSYYNIFDKEATIIAQLQNPRTPESRKNRDMHFAVSYHSLFLKKAAMNEDIFTFSCKSAPDLFAAFYGPDKTEFERIYNEYEANTDFKKEYVNARDLLVLCERQGYDVGTHYDFFADNANSHTPFKDPIYSSNLCVAPETLVLTDKGEFPIKSLVNTKVNVWNGHEWSKVEVVKTGENQELTTVRLASGKQLTCTDYHKWYIVDGKGHAVQERTSTLQIGDRIDPFMLPSSTRMVHDEVMSINKTGRIDDTYCFNEPKRHKGVFNGILTGQCLEIMEPTHPYKDSDQLHKAEYFGTITIEDTEGLRETLDQNSVCYFMYEDGGIDRSKTIFAGELEQGMKVWLNSGYWVINKIIRCDRQPEVALCSLGGIVEPNVRDDAHYEQAMYYTQRMIDYCIHKSDYPFAHIAFTAKKRLNAGIGLLGAATTMARKKLRYDTHEGLAEIQRMAERHMYFAIKCSITLGEERGNAPWIKRTKWPDGWMPIDSYNKNVDGVIEHKLVYDWETQRRRMIANKGMRFSCLCSHMPTESSSKAAGMPNSWYPVRQTSMKKSDSSNIIDWTAPDSDLIGGDYQPAWGISQEAMVKVYAVIQKFTDQGISADLYADRSKTPDLSASAMIETALLMQRLGLKSRYYINSRTDSGETEQDSGCGSGGCKL